MSCIAHNAHLHWHATLTHPLRAADDAGTLIWIRPAHLRVISAAGQLVSRRALRPVGRLVVRPVQERHRQPLQLRQPTAVALSFFTARREKQHIRRLCNGPFQ